MCVCVCVCVRDRVTSYQEQKMERRSRRKGGNKTEGHFIGPLSLGDTATKGGIRGMKEGEGGAGRPGEKVSSPVVEFPACLVQISAFVSQRSPPTIRPRHTAFYM